MNVTFFSYKRQGIEQPHFSFLEYSGSNLFNASLCGYQKKHPPISVADPNMHPDQDPNVFGPPGSASGSVSHKYGTDNFLSEE